MTGLDRLISSPSISEHRARHAVGGGVLRTHVEQHPLADALLGGDVVAGLLLGLGLGHPRVAPSRQEPFGAESSAPGRWRPTGSRPRRRAGPQWCSRRRPLNWTGMRAGASSLRSG